MSDHEEDFLWVQEEDFLWICGNEDVISHRRRIAHGGYGQVHEVRRLRWMLTDDVAREYGNKAGTYSHL